MLIKKLVSSRRVVSLVLGVLQVLVAREVDWFPAAVPDLTFIVLRD